MQALDRGQVSLRLYPHVAPAPEIVATMRRQAAAAERAGFDGVMTSEHHGGFSGYIPQPLQMAGFCLEATERIWAAACPLLLPLQHWSHVAEQVAWQAARFPGRVGVGVAVGGLEQDFVLADLDYAEKGSRWRQALPRFVEALRGEAPEPLGLDPALAACREAPIPIVVAAGGPVGVRRAAGQGVGVLYDSLQTVERLREISDAHAEAGGTAPRIGIRRVWIGPPPSAQVEAQMDFYRGYAAKSAQDHWGKGQELVMGADGGKVAEQLAELARQARLDAFNLRVHVTGLAPERVEEQIERLGAETLPVLRSALAG
jgi:alkanesulfonate monooxygenase SsuD/methylene tetrahydromethanopterin reductase-like flavin-dependent oxidoreductase (luciferase family)